MKRTEQREHIFKTLFALEFFAPEKMEKQLALYFKQRNITDEKDILYIKEKRAAVMKHIAEIDTMINTYAKKWKTTRMNKVDLAVLRLAIYEMKWDEEIPVPVAINEAVELAKKFGRKESPSFVNGILAQLAK